MAMRAYFACLHLGCTANFLENNSSACSFIHFADEPHNSQTQFYISPTFLLSVDCWSEFDEDPDSFRL